MPIMTDTLQRVPLDVVEVDEYELLSWHVKHDPRDEVLLVIRARRRAVAVVDPVTGLASTVPGP